jgi:NADH-quinone oxidoreductase subunit C
MATVTEQLQTAFPTIRTNEFRGQTRVVVPAVSLLDVLSKLKEHLGFDLLVDISCVDYLHYRDAKDRFGLVYLLANTATNERITVRSFVNDPEPTAP